MYNRSDSLAHTDPQDGDFASEMLDGISTDSRVCFRMSGARTNDQLGGIECGKGFDGDRIVAEDADTGTFKHKVLINIPGEGVEVVNQDYVCCILQRRSWLWLLRRVVYEIECRHGDGMGRRKEGGIKKAVLISTRRRGDSSEKLW